MAQLISMLKRVHHSPTAHNGDSTELTHDLAYDASVRTCKGKASGQFGTVHCTNIMFRCSAAFTVLIIMILSLKSNVHSALSSAATSSPIPSVLPAPSAMSSEANPDQICLDVISELDLQLSDGTTCSHSRQSHSASPDPLLSSNQIGSYSPQNGLGANMGNYSFIPSPTMYTEDEDRILYDKLVESMGQFQWQSAHGFRARKERGLSQLKPKYANVDEEALNKPHSPLSVNDWNSRLKKSLQFTQTWSGKKIRTRHKSPYNDQSQRTRDEWTRGVPLNSREIIKLKLYTDFDILQSELKKCFRLDGMDNTASDIKSISPRLSNFHQWRTKRQMAMSKYATKLDPMSTHSFFSPIALYTDFDRLQEGLMFSDSTIV